MKVFVYQGPGKKDLKIDPLAALGLEVAKLTGCRQACRAGSNLITRFYLFALLFVLASVVACDGTAAKPAAETPAGTRVETTGGAYTTVTPQELQTLLASKKALLINVHIPYVGEIKKTEAFIPYNEMDKNLAKLPVDKDATVVLYCRSGPMSKEAAEALVTLGYTNVWKLDRGMVGWQQAGLPIINRSRHE